MGEVRKQKDPAVEKRKETLRKRAKELISATISCRGISVWKGS